MSKLGKLSNYDDDPADARLVEAYLQAREDQRYGDMADRQNSNPVVKILIALALFLGGIIVFVTLFN